MALLRLAFRYYVSMVSVLLAPLLLSSYFARSTGREYGVGFQAKLRLLWRMRRNTRRVVCASHLLEHVAMATAILRIPKSVEGCVVECGCYKGGSSTNLSFVCELSGRRLEIFDSFAGLPEPEDLDRAHVLVDQRHMHTYTKGAWSGALEEVRGNITRYGAIGVCDFHVGFFDETLPLFTKKCVFVFVDVDLVSSLRVCLKTLWPLLQGGCPFYTHEAPHREISGAFFDRSWWEGQLDCEPPGLVGAGRGLGLIFSDGAFRSDLGYTIKDVTSSPLAEKPQIGVGNDRLVNSHS